MVRVGTLMAAVVALVMAAAPSPGAKANPVPYTGSVLNPQGKPIPRASLYLLQRDRSGTVLKPLLQTGASGQFTYMPPPKSRGGMPVVAKAAGYSYGEAYLSGRERTKITLYKELKLRGKVVDESGKPVVGTVVGIDSGSAYSTATSDSGGTMMRGVSFGQGMIPPATTGNDGRFVIGGLPDPSSFSQFYVTLNVAGAKRASVQKGLQASDMGGDLVLTQPLSCSLRGKLYMPGKSGPAPDVTLNAYVDSKWGWRPREAKTLPDGSFEFTDLPPGVTRVVLPPQYAIYESGNKARSPKPREWALVRTQTTVKPGVTNSTEVVLSRGSLVSGVVVDKKDGKPLANAEMQVQHRGCSQDDYSGDRLISDSEGKFTTRVPAGPASVIVERALSDGQPVYFYDSEDQPGVTLTARDDQDESDLRVVVDLQANGRGNPYELAQRPVPKDFAITPGAYKLSWDPVLDCSQASYVRTVASGKRARAMAKAVPGSLSDKATFTAFMLDGTGRDGMLLVAKDASDGKSYDRFYVDTDRDWDLSDEQPLNFTPPVRDYSRKYTDWITVQSHQGPKASGTANPVNVRLSIYKNNTEQYVGLERKGTWKCLVDTPGGKVEMALGDVNCNGLYNDLPVTRPNGDVRAMGDAAFVDANKAGRVVVVGYYNHFYMLQPVVKIGTRFYEIKPTETGDSVTIAAYSGPMGTIDVKVGKIGSMPVKVQAPPTFTGTNGTLAFRPDEKLPVSIPAGSYRISSCDLELETKNGKPIAAVCSSETPVDVAAGSHAVIDLDGGLTLSINPDEKVLSWKPGDYGTLDWRLKIGKSVTLTSIGDRSAKWAPDVKFFDKSGKVAAKVKAGFT